MMNLVRKEPDDDSRPSWSTHERWIAILDEKGKVGSNWQLKDACEEINTLALLHAAGKTNYRLDWRAK
jgi:hypothetical protein